LTKGNFRQDVRNKNYLKEHFEVPSPQIDDSVLNRVSDSTQELFQNIDPFGSLQHQK
jgi:hypothetical protein